MSAKITANEIQTHDRTNQRHTLAYCRGRAILNRRTATSTQPSQLCADSSTLEYKNANLFVT